MNMEEYKKAMNEISIDTEKVKNRFRETKDKNTYKCLNYKKLAFVFIMPIILIFTVSIFSFFNTESIPNITLKVYAADSSEEKSLSRIPVVLNTLHQPNMQSITNKGKTDETGSVTYNLSFQCIGENIKSITYKLSDKEITRENRGEAVAWFAESCKYYSYFESIADPENTLHDKSIYLKIREFDNLMVTKMIGSSYTVDYENQNDKQYLLEINLNSDGKGKLVAKNFIINVIITMNSGKTVEKQIFVKPLEVEQSHNEIYQIEMTLKE